MLSSLIECITLGGIGSIDGVVITATVPSVVYIFNKQNEQKFFNLQNTATTDRDIHHQCMYIIIVILMIHKLIVPRLIFLN